MNIETTRQVPQMQIAFGDCQCGEYGQLFRTGKCAHCYIAELEADVKRLADKVLAFGLR